MKINQYQLMNTLGKGGYATVKLCRHLLTNELYAMKSMSKKFLKSKFPAGKTQSAYDFVKDELKVLQTLEHPNIIYLHEIIDDPNRDHIYLITEYHSRGSLADRLHEKNKMFFDHNKRCLRDNRPQDCKYKGIRLAELRNYFLDMVKALHYCHNVVNVIHRDIKPENIVVSHNEEAVLIDFGVSFL